MALTSRVRVRVWILRWVTLTSLGSHLHYCLFQSGSVILAFSLASMQVCTAVWGIKFWRVVLKRNYYCRAGGSYNSVAYIGRDGVGRNYYRKVAPSSAPWM